jgi:hypothetical protein
MKYIRFSEHNDHEGETWHFYIPIKGNEKDIAKVRELIADVDAYRLDRELTEAQVDTLVEFDNESGYMARHNKAAGFNKLPKSVDWEDDDPFYKGRLIRYDETE